MGSRKRRRNPMRKSYFYVVLAVLISFLFGAGYYLYLEYRPVEYKNGTFVEVLPDSFEEVRKLAS